ncbi:ADP-ribose pyrophosphatase YjhB (NUDIX family) [Nocardioides albertanoniae]|uniref:ADP-ribose pyrophosphatase YjhB (NUDIX family) n=1 Tax=Nocardioides albertanoniae TaxID=1175486 RepID=A0A543A725_9ACTN|nr:NUDIX hydrolase [Nocardioides albertanoniae]TQL68415.1 ADP-ribose pyrophosphatase YjhB (NUDIX family) [Nocardioides albertanoniae]
MTEFAAVILVDPGGWVLLQERDEHPRIAPEKWSFSGGHLEPAEDPLAGALRELEEETEVRLRPDDLEPVTVLDVHHPETGTDDKIHLYAAAVGLTDADIVCHEGRQIVFVDPAKALDLDLSDQARLGLGQFLGSAQHAALSESAGLRVET